MLSMTTRFCCYRTALLMGLPYLQAIKAYTDIIMEIENCSDSDCELVIDETIILSSDEENMEVRKSDILPQNFVKVTATEDDHSWSNNGLYKGLFHPESISSADMKEELFIEETNTCGICNESFKYNVGLIYHLEMEHKEDIEHVKKKKNKIVKRIGQNSRKTMASDSNIVSIEHDIDSNKEKFRKICVSNSNENLKVNATTVIKKSCEICKKSFTDQSKMSKHVESCLKVGLKFQCMYCKSKFGWESKYKKHLFKTHKLNAAVICKLCSSVFSDMTSLVTHVGQCDKKTTDNITEISLDDDSQ